MKGMEPNVVLMANDLCKTFSNESVQQHVLKNLNIVINQGDFVVIMGSSGSGKSTLLYALSGMENPTLGTVTIGGKEISKLSNDKLAVIRREHCGFVFQQNFLNNTMTVMENIMVSGLLKNKNRKEIKKRAMELLQQADLKEGTAGPNTVIRWRGTESRFGAWNHQQTGDIVC